MSQNRQLVSDYGPQTRRNLFLPDALLEDIKEIAAANEVSYSEVIRQVLTAFVAKRANKRKTVANG